MLLCHALRLSGLTSPPLPYSWIGEPYLRMVHLGGCIEDVLAHADDDEDAADRSHGASRFRQAIRTKDKPFFPRP